MGLVPLRDLPKPKLPKLREPERSRRDLEKGRKSRNAIYRGAKKKERKKDRTCGGVKGSAGGR